MGWIAIPAPIVGRTPGAVERGSDARAVLESLQRIVVNMGGCSTPVASSTQCTQEPHLALFANQRQIARNRCLVSERLRCVLNA